VSEAKLASISRENSWPKIAEENSSEEIKRIGNFFIPASIFRRAIELSDKQLILTEDPGSVEKEGEFSTSTRESTQTADNRVWICRMEAETNLRCFLEAFPRGRYLVTWRFSYSGSPPYNPGVTQAYQIYKCSVGKACDPAMFVSRVSDPSQPFISNDLNQIINPRCTMPLRLPWLTVTKTELPESVLVTAQMSLDVDLVDPNLLEVTWDTGLAFLVKKFMGSPMGGTLIFKGVFLFKQESKELSKEKKRLVTVPIDRMPIFENILQ
jgi:hypothetical protein